MVVKKPRPKNTKKRPAAVDPEGDDVKKRPSSWQAFGEEAERDTSSITKAQRYLFDKAMKNGSLPDEVQQAHDEIKMAKKPGYPKELNAVVNAVVPKDAGYASVIDWSQPVTMKRFETLFNKQTVTKQQASYP